MGAGIAEENGGRQNITFDTGPGQAFLVPQGMHPLAASFPVPLLLLAVTTFKFLTSLSPSQDFFTTMSIDSALRW